MADLRKSRAPVHNKTLADLLQDSKWKLKTLFHVVSFPGEGSEEGKGGNPANEPLDSATLLVMVKSQVQSDRHLKRLADYCSFPRGFPIVWYRASGEIVSFGFYPKFDNDKALPVVKMENFKGAREIRFFRKWSGFLSMVVPVRSPRDPSRTCWTVTSKNSAIYVDGQTRERGRGHLLESAWGRRPSGTEAGDERGTGSSSAAAGSPVSHAASGGAPQAPAGSTKGASLEEEMATLTVQGLQRDEAESREAMGSFVGDAKEIWERQISGALLAELGKEQISLCAETMSEWDQTHGAQVLTNCAIVTAVGRGAASWMADRASFVEYEDILGVSDFCRRFNVPVDEPILVEGSEKVQLFIQKLEEHRDFMTEATFQSQVLRPLGLRHDSPHGQVLGDVLEGLVLHCWSTTGGSSQDPEAHLTRTTLKYKFPNYTCRTFGLREVLGHGLALDSPSAFSRYQAYVSTWCYTEEGRTFWLNFLFACGLFVAKGRAPKLDNDLVGYHIRVADYTLSELRRLSTSTEFGLRGLEGPLASVRRDFPGAAAAAVSNLGES